MSRSAPLIKVPRGRGCNASKAENQRLDDKCIQFGLEIAIREEEDTFKRGLLPAAGPNLRIPLPSPRLYKQSHELLGPYRAERSA